MKLTINHGDIKYNFGVAIHVFLVEASLEEVLPGAPDGGWCHVWGHLHKVFLLAPTEGTSILSCCIVSYNGISMASWDDQGNILYQGL